MNNLNSILVEGTLMNDPVTTNTEQTRTAFNLYSVHYEKGGQFSDITVPIKTTGRLAEVCADYLKAGRGVRVVGRLAQNNTELYVHAEHVEFKPERDRKEQTT